MIYKFEHGDRSYAIDAVIAYAATEVDEDGNGRDVELGEIPLGDFRDRIAAQLVADWAADCCTVPTPAERHLAKSIVHAILPKPDGDKQSVETVLRRLWTQQGEVAA